MIQNNLRNIFDDYNRKLGNHRLSLYQLSKITDIPRTTLNRLMSDPNKSMNGKTLNNLIEFFDVPVNKMIVYQRKPYQFQLMNANKITSQKLKKRVKSHLSCSVVLHSVDYHQTIVFTPSISIKKLKDTVIKANKTIRIPMNHLIFGIKYANITKYPIYDAIQCGNLLNTVHFPLPISNPIMNQLLMYVAYTAVLHSGLITRDDDFKCTDSGLIATFNGFKATVHNSRYFKLKPLQSSSIEFKNKKMIQYNRANVAIQNMNGGYFSNPINYYRKHFGKSTKNGYEFNFKHFNLTDKTTVNFAKN